VARQVERQCSFCGKREDQVRLVAGPGVFICDQCVALCSEILQEDPKPAEASIAESKTRVQKIIDAIRHSYKT